MLFKRSFHAGLRDGTITLTFRSWAKPKVRVGGSYRVYGAGVLEVDALQVVPIGRISAEEAKRAGFTSRKALVETLQQTSGKSSQVYRVEFHWAGEIQESDLPERDAFDDQSLAELRERLRAMDTRSSHGPWVMKVLRLIAKRPEVGASQLAKTMGRDVAPFKADVRKLKRLGLTISHEVGYSLSPRGKAFLGKVRRL